MRKNIRNTAQNKFSRGISLIEACIVLVIAGLMVSSALQVMKLQRARQVIDMNNQRLDAIKGAIAGYVAKYDRLPCPAARNLPTSDVRYGRADCAATPPGVVKTKEITVPPALPKWVSVGALPADDLGLPSEYMVDSWGHLFVYAVTEALTVSPVDITKAAVKVVDTRPLPPPALPPPRNITALYVVLSPGKDGRGAYTAEGNLISACGTAVTQGVDFQNCDHTSNVNPQFALAPTGVLVGNTQHFDDMLAFSTTVNNITLPGCNADETLVSADGVNFTCKPYEQPDSCLANERLTSDDGITFYCKALPVLPPCLPTERLSSSNGFDFTCIPLPPPPPPPPPPPALPDCAATNSRLISTSAGFACKKLTLSTKEVFEDTTNTSGSWWTATANCGSGWFVTGGGWNASFIDPLYGRYTGRSGNGWACKFRVGGGSSMGDCRALCAKIN